MSNDPSYLGEDGLDRTVETISKPIPAHEDQAEALAEHFGRANARLVGFLTACAILDQSQKEALLGRLTPLVELATTRDLLPTGHHIDMALEELAAGLFSWLTLDLTE